MTTALHRQWPFYALLGAGAALALHQACRRHPRRPPLQAPLQDKAIGTLRELRLKVNGQDMHARVATGAGNAAGGYVVTERMLEMFKPSDKGKK